MKLKIFGLLILLITISCGQKQQDAKIIITFDEETKNRLNELSSTVNENKEFGLGNPADIAAFKCFGLMVTYPELTPINVCDVDQGPVVPVRPDALGGLVGFPGGELSMLVKSGVNRTLQLIGFDSQVGCPDLHTDITPLEQYMSKPYILGHLSGVAIVPGDQSITMTASYVYENTTRLVNCRGPLFNTLPVPFLLCAGNPSCNLWLTTRPTVLTNTIGATVYEDLLSPITNATDAGQAGYWRNLKDFPLAFNATSAISAPTYYINADGNSRAMLTFNGTDQYLKPYNGGFFTPEGTIIVVFRSPVTPSNKVILGTRTSSSYEISIRLMSDRKIQGAVGIGTSSLATSTSFSAIEGTNIAYMAYKIGDVGVGTLEVCVNQDCVSDSTKDYRNPDYNLYPFFIGGTSYDTTPYDFANVKIGEVLVYNRFLTANERDMAISLLKSAWGI